ncbi:butyrate kinase [Oscillospiraceae bacterium MB08-C2-2]|nr:butyrate kinase [Oscillospiraceae bacterium MB08-C2-2]
MILFVINIGASSTKLAVYLGEQELTTQTIRHPSQELKDIDGLWNQLDYRRRAVEQFLQKSGFSLTDFAAIVSRGPVVKPLKSGTYEINEAMLQDAKSGKYGMHPCGLGCQIAYDIAKQHNIPAFTVDPPCVDEMIDVARITGLPQIERVSFFQALNHKAKGREYAKSIGRTYEQLNLVITHLGSGISVASHEHGRVIDVTNGLHGDSPFGFDRVGTLPAKAWAEFCIKNKLTLEELKEIINGGGGTQAHLNANNAIEIETMIQNGDTHAELIFRAMAFQVGKGIGAAAAALSGKPDAIIITGGLAHSTRFMGHIKPMVEWMAPLYVNPDDNEVRSLAQGAARALEQTNLIKQY